MQIVFSRGITSRNKTLANAQAGSTALVCNSTRCEALYNKKRTAWMSIHAVPGVDAEDDQYMREIGPGAIAGIGAEAPPSM